MRIFTIIISIALLCGCASHPKVQFKAGTGDAGRFILQQAVARGGQLITTNGLPTIRGPWRYSEDQYGVVVRMLRDDYETVEKLLRLAFGEPAQPGLPAAGRLVDTVLRH